MAIKYDDAHYAATRLVETYIKNNGRLLYVTGFIRPSFVCKDMLVPEDDMRHYVRLRNRDLNVEPVTLGYYNVAGMCGYLSRVPKRRDWRQGVRLNNVLVNFTRMPSSAVFPDALKYCHIGKFPTLEEAHETSMKELERVVAFTPTLAVSGDTLVWKCRRVGRINVGNLSHSILSPKYRFLREYLERSVK